MNAERAYRLFPAVVAVLTLLAFLPALGNDFVDWDDLPNFTVNTAYRGLGWEQIRWMWTTHLADRYIPLTWMTLGLDYTIWGMNPFGYHLTSVLWHAANAVLFYFLALAILRFAIPAGSVEARSRIPLGALAAALVFALHPLRVESVAWASERRDVVSGLFYLLALLAYLRASRDAPARPIQRKYYWACFGFFVLAILGKEIAVTLPLVLLVLDVYPLGRLGGAGVSRWIGPSVRAVWLEKIPFLAVSLADGVAVLLTANFEGINNPHAGLGWLARIAMSVYSLAFYLWKTVAPFQLSPFYPLTAHKTDVAAAPFWISTTVALTITAAAILMRRRAPAFLAVWLAYALTLGPVLGMIYNGPQITADRYSYLACMGWALLAGAVLVWWKGPRRWLAPAAAVLVVAGLAVLTWRQCRVWRDSETLWTHALAIEPSHLALTLMGTILTDRGDYLWAAEHFRQAIALQPDYWVAHNDLANCLGNLGEWGEAVREYQITLRVGVLPSQLATVENDLGYALLKLGRLDEAIQHFETALKIRPSYQTARDHLEVALAKKSSRGAARTQ